MPKGPVAQGASFSFPVTWNLTQSSINDAQNASFGKVLPGAQSTSLELFTTNAVAKYSTVLPISLSGVTVSQDAFFTISPPAVVSKILKLYLSSYSEILNTPIFHQQFRMSNAADRVALLKCNQ